VSRHPDSESGERRHPASRRWAVKLAATIGAWLAAWGVVVALLSLFGKQLGSLPLALRALTISGVLVVLMIHLVMPVLSRLLARWVAGAGQS
jgi:antibiotic biosynthesis monooxygenase (ABM) superfamily enzyme